jgi:hypothetical protein
VYCVAFKLAYCCSAVHISQALDALVDVDLNAYATAVFAGNGFYLTKQFELRQELAYLINTPVAMKSAGGSAGVAAAAASAACPIGLGPSPANCAAILALPPLEMPLGLAATYMGLELVSASAVTAAASAAAAAALTAAPGLARDPNAILRFLGGLAVELQAPLPVALMQPSVALPEAAAAVMSLPPPVSSAVVLSTPPAGASRASCDGGGPLGTPAGGLGRRVASRTSINAGALPQAATAPPPAVSSAATPDPPAKATMSTPSRNKKPPSHAFTTLQDSTESETSGFISWEALPHIDSNVVRTCSACSCNFAFVNYTRV